MSWQLEFENTNVEAQDETMIRVRYICPVCKKQQQGTHQFSKEMVENMFFPELKNSCLCECEKKFYGIIKIRR